MPERAVKDVVVDRAKGRVVAPVRPGRTNFRLLPTVFDLRALFRIEILTILASLFIFGAFIINALFLQSGLRTVTILDGIGLPGLSKGLVGVAEKNFRADRTSAYEGLDAIPIPPRRSEDSGDRARDPIEAILPSTIASEPNQREILYIQQVLNKIGYGPLSENGVFSMPVKLAISRFEKDRKMVPTGLIDPALVREVGRASGTPLE